MSSTIKNIYMKYKNYYFIYYTKKMWIKRLEVNKSIAIFRKFILFVRIKIKNKVLY